MTQLKSPTLVLTWFYCRIPCSTTTTQTPTSPATTLLNDKTTVTAHLSQRTLLNDTEDAFHDRLAAPCPPVDKIDTVPNAPAGILHEDFPQQIRSVTSEVSQSPTATAGVTQKTSQTHPLKPTWDDKCGQPSLQERKKHFSTMTKAFPRVFDVTSTLRKMSGGLMDIELTEDSRPTAVSTARSIRSAGVRKYGASLMTSWRRTSSSRWSIRPSGATPSCRSPRGHRTALSPAAA